MRQKDAEEQEAIFHQQYNQIQSMVNLSQATPSVYDTDSERKSTSRRH
jgi:hypothetical protein